MINGAGSAACDKTVRRLIERVTRRVFTDGDLAPADEKLTATFPATPESLSEYYRLERFADREEYHARLQTFSNAGAVRIDWDRSAGERVQLARVTLINPRAAAELLEIELPWVVAAAAIQNLKAATKEDRQSSVDQVVDAWRHGKALCGVSAEKASQFIDSMRVIEAVRGLAADSDLLMRRVSAQLFGDSKRIESLERQIAFLVGDSHNYEEGDVFSRLGLVKYPQPMLLSGPQSCSVRVGNESIPLVRPYLGLRPDTIKGFENSEVIKQCLTIENLATFNEAAQDTTNPKDLLLIYVAGNPTPALLAAYKRILESVKPSNVMHWGDIDVGGFRIAARVADVACEAGYRLRLWCMNPLNSVTNQNAVTDGQKINEIVDICKARGWMDELEGFKRRPIFQEQELRRWEPPRMNEL